MRRHEATQAPDRSTTAQIAVRYSTAAVAWALGQVGERAYPLRCLAFVEDAYERPNGIEIFGGDSAAESAERYATAPYDPLAPPPAGAFVFYACGGPVDGTHRDWGHVGLALGDGRVVHAWDEVRVDEARDVEDLHPAAGWTPPRLIGWAPPTAIIEGHRARDWADG